MFGRVVNTLLTSTPQYKYKIKFQREDQNTAKENRKEMNLIKEMLEHEQEFYFSYIPYKE